MATAIDFYFDFSSSYSYMGQKLITGLADRHGLKVNWRPIALGAIFKQLGHAPPIGDSLKSRYIKHDVERFAALCDLPYRWPRQFPFNSIPAARIFWHLADTDSKTAVNWARGVFHAAFGEGRDCSDPEVLAAVASDLGHDADAMLAATGNDVIKKKLIDVTGAAMERGVFGAPTFFVGDEMYWGADRVAHLESTLDGNSA